MVKSLGSKIAAVLVGLCLAACNESQTRPAQPEHVRAAIVAPIAYRQLATQRAFTAIIRPRIEGEQGFRVAGKVSARLVNIGAKVKAGDILARLDETDLKLQVDQVEAEAKAAQTAKDQGERDEKRSGTLLSAGWATQAAHDRLKTAAEEARGRLLRAQRGLLLTRNALAYAVLKAEYDGFVTSVMIEPGQVVAAGQPAFRIARLGEKEALVGAPENDLDLFRKGRAQVWLWSAPERKYRAVLRELSPVADGAGRTYSARFSLPDADETFALGMSATLSLSLEEQRKIARAPLTAILNQGSGTFVFVVGEAGALRLVPVVVDRYDEEYAYLSSGPPDGAQIVAVGVQSLDEKQRIRPISSLEP